MISINIFAISALINGIVSTVFGLIVISKNWRDKTNQVFLLMMASLAVWSFSYWQWQLSTDYATALLWVKILSVGSLFVPIFFYNWIIRLLKIDNSVNKILLWIVYTTSVTTLFFVNSNLFIANLERKSIFPFWPNSGPAYDTYFTYIYLGLTSYAVYLLLRTYYTEKDTEKRGQILYILFACLFGFGGGLTNFPLWWGVNILPIGNFFVAVFPFMLGYSAFKYKLFNIRALASELLLFSLMIFMLTAVFLADTMASRLIYIFFLIVSGLVSSIIIKNSYTIDNLVNAQAETLNFITHQIRGIFTSTKAGLASIADGDNGKVPNSVKEIANQMLKIQDKGVSSVETFLKANRIENGIVQYDMNPFDFKLLVTELADQEKARAESKGLKYEVQISEGDYTFKGDQVYMSQAISNLIDNAIRYTKEGLINISLAIADNNIIFSVRDSGVGINSADGKKLFTKYGHGMDSRKINTDSNGLGLFIVKGIVTGHHGKIWYESPGDGGGTTFFIKLPLLVNRKV